VGCSACGCGLQVRDGRFQFIGRPWLCPWVLWGGVLAGGIVLILVVWDQIIGILVGGIGLILVGWY